MVCKISVSQTYPEDVVDEETAQQDASGADFVQLQKLDSVRGERKTEDVVGDPVLKMQTMTLNQHK